MLLLGSEAVMGVLVEIFYWFMVVCRQKGNLPEREVNLYQGHCMDADFRRSR